jgi:hypothetical protein
MKHISKRERKHTTKKITHFVARTELLANGKIWVRMERPRHQQMVDEQRPPCQGDDLKDEQ